jgi:hypothetical protein
LAHPLQFVENFAFVSGFGQHSCPLFFFQFQELETHSIFETVSDFVRIISKADFDLVIGARSKIAAWL